MCTEPAVLIRMPLFATVPPLMVSPRRITVSLSPALIPTPFFHAVGLSDAYTPGAAVKVIALVIASTP